jgi:hypothetical protein
MAMRAFAAAACCACLLPSRMAHGQTITTEAALTAGFSTDDVSAAAVQARAFGDVKGGVRVFAEASWARSSDGNNDAFTAAYPYGNRVEIVEAYGERMFRPRQAIVGIRAGRFRTPFGIFNGSDHAYSGFLRPPLLRYDEYSGVSNSFLEHGADLVIGVPRLTIEAALGAPADVGPVVRRSGLDSVTRLQGYFGPLVAGVSHIRTSPLQSAEVDHGRVDFTGIDLRWTYNGIQMRGEWMTGHPAEGVTTTGWYADGLIHLDSMGPVTAVARLEQLDTREPEHAEPSSATRQTVGARIRFVGGFSLSVNLVHRRAELRNSRPSSLDVGLTWSGRHRP